MPSNNTYSSSSSHESKESRRRRLKNESARRCRERRVSEDAHMAYILRENERRILQLQQEVDSLAAELAEPGRPLWFGKPF